MNGLTTIAALPGSGAGCAAALPAEVGEKAPPKPTDLQPWQVEIVRAIVRKFVTSGVFCARAPGKTPFATGGLVGKRATQMILDELGSGLCASAICGVDPGAGDGQTSTGIYAFEEGGLVRIGDVPTPADKQGFEPWEYTERS